MFAPLRSGMTNDVDEDDVCRTIVDVALDRAADRCGSKEAVREQIGDMFGFRADEDLPNCEMVLEDGITPDDLQTANTQRRYAMCRAWELIEEEKMGFRSAINMAWAEIRQAEEQGVEEANDAVSSLMEE